MGTVQLLTDQMVAAGLSTQAPTSENVLHEEAEDLPNPDVSKPLQKVDPDIYSEAITAGKQQAAKDSE